MSGQVVALYFATISSTGLATGVSLGTTDITASLDSITSNTATLTVETPVTVSLTTPSASTGVAISTPIVITFSGAVEPGTVTSSTFEVGTHSGSSNIPGSIVMSGGNTIATFTPTSSLSFNSTVYVTVTSGILDSFGNPITANSFSFTTQVEYLIYVTTATTNGNLSGVTGADTICQSDSQCPNGATCKAMLVDTDRSAFPTSVNWVLQASTAYANTSNQLIGITTTGAIFNFPLSNAIGSGTIWTGLNTDWTSSSNNCSNWTTSVNGPQGNTGSALVTSSLAIHSSNATCISAQNLYCAQQP